MKSYILHHNRIYRMCMQRQTCPLIHHLIQKNINVHGSRRKVSVFLFYLLGNVHTHAVEHYTLHWIMKNHPLWRWPAPFTQKIRQYNYPTWTKEKNIESVIDKKKEDRKTFSYPILCPLCHLHQRNNIKTKFTQLRIYFNVACQVHIFVKKASKKRGNLIAQVHHTDVK